MNGTIITLLGIFFFYCLLFTAVLVCSFWVEGKGKVCISMAAYAIAFLSLFIWIITSIWPTKNGKVVERVNSSGDLEYLYVDSTRFCNHIYDDPSITDTIPFDVHNGFHAIVEGPDEKPSWHDICIVCGKEYCEHYCKQRTLDLINEWDGFYIPY